MLIFILKKDLCKACKEIDAVTCNMYIYFVFAIAMFVMLRGKQCCDIICTKAMRVLHIFMYVAYSRPAATSTITIIMQESGTVSLTVSSWC